MSMKQDKLNEDFVLDDVINGELEAVDLEGSDVADEDYEHISNSSSSSVVNDGFEAALQLYEKSFSQQISNFEKELIECDELLAAPITNESPIERKECWVELEPEAVSRGLSVAELRSRVLQDIESKKDVEWDRLLVELDSARAALPSSRQQPLSLPAPTPYSVAIDWSSARGQGDTDRDSENNAGVINGTLVSVSAEHSAVDNGDDSITGQAPVVVSDLAESDDAALLSALHMKIIQQNLAQQSEISSPPPLSIMDTGWEEEALSRQQELRLLEEAIQCQNTHMESIIQKDAEELELKMKDLHERQLREIAHITEQIEREQETVRRAAAEEAERRDKLRVHAAQTIVAAILGYRARKVYGSMLAERVQEAAKLREQQRIEELEKARKLQLEQEEKQRMENERAAKEEGERRQRVEEERLKQERLEQERLEQERKRLEQERLEQERLQQEKLEQEAKAKALAEQKRREAEEKKRREKEQKEAEKREKKRLEEEEKAREKQGKEEEQKRQKEREEAEKREQKRQEDEKQARAIAEQQEQDRKRREEEQAEAERIKLHIIEVQREKDRKLAEQQKIKIETNAEHPEKQSLNDNSNKTQPQSNGNGDSEQSKPVSVDSSVNGGDNNNANNNKGQESREPSHRNKPSMLIVDNTSARKPRSARASKVDRDSILASFAVPTDDIDDIMVQPPTMASDIKPDVPKASSRQISEGLETPSTVSASSSLLAAEGNVVVDHVKQDTAPATSATAVAGASTIVPSPHPPPVAVEGGVGSKKASTPLRTPRSARQHQRQASSSGVIVANAGVPVTVQQGAPVALNSERGWGDYLPRDIEERRWLWMKRCTPWSKIESQLSKPAKSSGKKTVARTVGNKQLPPIDPDLILSSAHVSTLAEVTTVELCDLPGSSLSTLSQCSQLCCVILDNCNLVSVDDLNTCSQLALLDVKNNAIDSVGLWSLSQLTVVDLSHNMLTSIGCLSSCTNIRHLNLSHNNIVRLGDTFSGFRHLHTLLLSHNHLTSTKGLGVASTLQVLDLSNNDLTAIDDLWDLCLLQLLDVSVNSLTKLWNLTNHVLLHTLKLDNNNMSSLAPLTDAWLPHLAHLTASQNSITEVCDLSSCLLLSELDISNNLIEELPCLLQGIEHCRCLQQLFVAGCPVTLEPLYRAQVLQSVPSLCSLDGAPTGLTPVTLKRTIFEYSCLSHNKLHIDLAADYQQQLQTSRNVEATCFIHQTFFERSQAMAVELRYAHEYGTLVTTGLTVAMPMPSVQQQAQSASLHSLVPVPPSTSTVSLLNTSSPKTISSTTATSTLSSNVVTPRKSLSTSSPKSNASASVGNSATITAPASSDQVNTVSVPLVKPEPVNSAGIGYMAGDMGTMNGAESAGKGMTPRVQVGDGRGDHTVIPAKAQLAEVAMSPAAVVKAPLGNGLQANINKDRQDKAATVIQAVWRGYVVRKRLSQAMAFAQQWAGANDDDIEEFAEVNLDEFDVDKMIDDGQWLLDDVTAAAGAAGNHSEAHISTKPPLAPVLPRQAWKTNPSPRNTTPVVGGQPLDTGRTVESHKTKSSKKDELAEEWGFKDAKTAELMVRRAQKLKYNSDRRHKISKLDAQQRLAFFRKLELAQQRPPPAIAPQRKPRIQRVDYFQAKEEAEERQREEDRQERHERARRMLDWIQAQPSADDTSTVISGHTSQKPSNWALPRMDTAVLNSGRAYLMASPSLDVQSIGDSASASGSKYAFHRRHSTNDNEGDKLPPINKSSSASSQPRQRPSEKMSWRSPEVNASVGWGGGRKRTGNK